jgi:hypothetical protein
MVAILLQMRELAAQGRRRGIFGVALLVLDDLAHFGRRVAILARQHDCFGVRIPVSAPIFITRP